MRPLVFLGMYVEFGFFGQASSVSHTINFLIFLINVFLVFSLALRVAKLRERRCPDRLAFLAALFYVIHPSLIESVAWVSGRFDLMVTMFMLAAACVFLSDMGKWLKISLVSVLMMCALLSKELGLVLPGVLFCLWMACYGDCYPGLMRGIASFLKKNCFLCFCMMGVYALYFVLRRDAMGEVYHLPWSLNYLVDVFVEQLPFDALRFYFFQTILPFYSVSPLHPMEEFSREGVGNLFVVIFVMTFMGFALLRREVSSWLFFAYFACLLPVLHLVPLTIGGNIGHERFLCAPLSFAVISLVMVRYDRLASMVSFPIRRGKYLLALLGVGWGGVAVLTIVSVLPFWGSELQLWNWAYKTHPNFAYARYNFLYGAIKESRFELVESEIERLQQENGGLEVGEQLLYAILLINKEDPEGMKYLEGVFYALPKFYEMSGGRQKANNFLLTSMQIGGGYAAYASGALIFEADAKKALKYNEIAGWYLSESEQIPVLYQRAAILYALGRFEQSERLYTELSKLHYYNENNVKSGAKKLLASFCGLRPYEFSCVEMKKRNLWVDSGNL